MKIGDNISPTQRHLLEMTKRYRGGTRLYDAFRQLVEDGDIRRGEEEIHPDWLKIFESRQDDLRSGLPDKMFERVKSFFAEISPFDRVLSTLDPEKLKIVFLLGAGASKPVPSNIPTVKELLPQLLERARRLDRDDVTKLADFCDERKINNIEDLLTAAQLATFCSRSPTVLRLLNFLLFGRDSESAEEELFAISPWELRPQTYRRRVAASAADVSSVAFLQDTLQVLFGLLASTMLPAKPNKAHEFIASYSLKHPETAIVTTNYDCCMDLALEDVNHPFHYCVDFANRRAPEAKHEQMARLVKLHGSLNWYYCETCQEVQLVDIRGILKGYAEDQSPYPVIGICKDCGGQRRGLLVPPLAMKFDVAPPLTPLLSEAKGAFENADLISVVGFSFAEADIYISRMISKSMQTRTGQKLLVVDPDVDVVSRVRRKFKASIPNFDETRIVHLTGDCAEMLPKFLTGELKQSALRQAAVKTERVAQTPRKRRAKLVAEQTTSADS